MSRFVAPLIPVACLAGLLLALAPLSGQAQTSAKKPAADASKTLSGGAGKGKMLTFKELEVCLKDQDALKTRPPELQRRRDAMEAERKTIKDAGDALNADTDALKQLSERVKGFNARMHEQGEKVKAWKAHNEEFGAANKTGMSADRERKDLEHEREELQKSEAALDQEGKALNAEKDKLSGAFNERATAQQKAAEDWNARSRLLDADFQSYEDDRLDWKQRCADRPYHEEWEKMIRQGK
jgi:chromosome segregation ATPase